METIITILILIGSTLGFAGETETVSQAVAVTPAVSVVTLNSDGLTAYTG